MSNRLASGVPSIPPIPSIGGSALEKSGISKVLGGIEGIGGKCGSRTEKSPAARSFRILIDNREPAPHPWEKHFSDAARVEWGTLETGDVALAALTDGVVVERKTVPDFLACVGRERERFERELRRSRYVGRFIVVVEGTLWQCLQAGAPGAPAGRTGIHPNAVLGTVAAWTRRFCPIVFAGDTATAARMAEAFLRGQIKDAERQSKALAFTGPSQPETSTQVAGAASS